MCETKPQDKQKSARWFTLRRLILALSLIISIPLGVLGLIILPDLIRPVADPNPAARVEELVRVLEAEENSSAADENHGTRTLQQMIPDLPATMTLSNDELTTIGLLRNVYEDNLRWLVHLPSLAHDLTYAETWRTINAKYRTLNAMTEKYKKSLPPDSWEIYTAQIQPKLDITLFQVILAIDVDHEEWTNAAINCAVEGQRDGELYYLRKKGWVGRYWIARCSMTQRFGPKLEAFLTGMENHVVYSRVPQAEPKYADFLELRRQYDYAGGIRKEREAIRQAGGN